jgi:hypothetical protein
MKFNKLLLKSENMTIFQNLPHEIEAVFREFRSCELSTCSKDGTPVTWPVEPHYQPEKGRFLITTSIGLAQKAYNIRRNPHVSMFFSNPTASGLVDPPAILVQGDAKAPDEIKTTFTGELAEFGRIAFSRQPAAKSYSSNLVMRYLFDWYYMRLLIYVTPLRILWWDHADFNKNPHEMEVSYVV